MSAIADHLSKTLGETLGEANVVPWAAMPLDTQQQIVNTLAADPLPDYLPACMAMPSTVAELAQVMAIAAQNRWRVLPTGQSSKLSWGGLADSIDMVISTAKLNRVIDHAIGDYTVTVESGLKVADLQTILAAQGQFLAIDPTFAQVATVGGVVATADTGSLRQRYGGLRDLLIGVQFVRYDGEVARAGGRVVKNVAGYDLMKLMTGAYGSLGILSELTFRLYPVQNYSRTLVLSGGAQAIEAATAEVRLSGLTPVALDVTLKAHNLTALSLIARFQGVADGVEEQTLRLKKIATTHSMPCKQLDGAEEAAFWQSAALEIKPNTVLCKVGLRPSGIPWLIELIDEVMLGAEARLYGSSGLGWLQFEIADKTPEDMVSGLEKLRSHCQKNAGFLTLLQAPKSLKQSIEVWGYSGNAIGVMSDIKQKFDPHCLLSPGRFVGGL